MLAIKGSPHDNLDHSLNNSFGFTTNRDPIDSILFLIILSLFMLGLLAAFSSYYHFSNQKFAVDKGLYYFINRQLLWAFISLLFMFFFMMVKIEFLYRITPFLWIVTVILNILPALGVFGSIRGGSRWLFWGSFSFQPSELAKLTVALYLSRVLYRKSEHLETDWNSALKPALMTVALCTPIYFQTDLSTTLFIVGMSIIIFFIGGVALRYIVIEISLILALGLSSIQLIGYRAKRIFSWLNPDSDPLGAGWQARMARDAIEEGGILGVGLGEGTYKLGRISLASSDYIFAVIAEESGFMGAFIVVALFIALVGRSHRISLSHLRGYESNLTISLALLIAGQAFLNMAVVVGIFPVTGVPLPYFSAGGSSLLVTMSMSGILLNLSRGVNRDQL